MADGVNAWSLEASGADRYVEIRYDGVPIPFTRDTRRNEMTIGRPPADPLHSSDDPIYKQMLTVIVGENGIHYRATLAECEKAFARLATDPVKTLNGMSVEIEKLLREHPDIRDPSDHPIAITFVLAYMAAVSMHGQRVAQHEQTRQTAKRLAFAMSQASVPRTSDHNPVGNTPSCGAYYFPKRYNYLLATWRNGWDTVHASVAQAWEADQAAKAPRETVPQTTDQMAKILS